MIKGGITMEFSFSLKIKATKEDAWEYYANIEKWYDWDEDLKNITLKGKFVKPFEEFWDKTETPFGDILFGHQIIDNNDGSVNIKHTVILDSEDEQHLEFLKQVFSDVPQSIFILKNRLEK